MIFKTLVAIPDERQVEWIQTLCKEKCSPNAEVGVGLLVAAKEFSRLSVNQHYPTDFHYSVAIERYINAVKELPKLKKEEEWMSKNKKLWEWMNRWFWSDSLGHQHIRSDLSGRRDDTVHSSSAGLSNHRRLESEMGPVIGNTSESDDSRWDQIIVQGAVEPAVNGMFT